MTYNIEEEAKRFIERKKVQFRKGLTESASNMTEFIEDNLPPSSERDYAVKAIQEAVLWCNSNVDKHGIK